jgi:signal peptidase II
MPNSAALAALAVFIVDRVTKVLFCKNLAEGQSVAVLPGMFHFSLVLNKGAAFGLLRGQNILLIASSLAAAGIILYYFFVKKPKSPVLGIALGLILGGAAGNLLDRILFGHVIDFLDFRIWPVFNIADSAITIGTAILIFVLFFKRTA